MLIPPNIIANADDLGLNSSVNQGILLCFERGYVNSTSLLTNTAKFEEAAEMICENRSMHNIGVHINLADGKPVTNFSEHSFLSVEGNWNISRVKKKIHFLSAAGRR